MVWTNIHFMRTYINIYQIRTNRYIDNLFYKGAVVLSQVVTLNMPASSILRYTHAQILNIQVLNILV